MRLLSVEHQSRGLSSHPVRVENSPLKQLYSPLEKEHQLPPVRGSTCFDDHLTRPLHANLLQHETESVHTTKQESPAIADKPARRKSLPKLLQFNVPTTLSLTILAYLDAFNCYCVRNPRNPEKFTENSNLWSSRSSKVIDLGAN